MPTYTVRIVEQDGTVVRTLTNANIQSVRFGMNGDPGEAVFSYPKYDPAAAVGQAADVLLLDREAEIRRDGTTTIFRGPMVRREAGSNGEMIVTVPGVGWYFGRLFIDAPVRNLLSNGDFEGGTTDWTATACTQASATDEFRRGTKALRLTNSTTFEDAFSQHAAVSVTGTGVGTELTVAAHFKIESWSGPAVYSRGLFIESRNGGVVETYNEHEGAIDDDTALALGEWQRVEATLWVPPNATRDIYVRLYSPNASIVWDEVALVEPTSLAIGPGAPEDIAETANRIVAFAQDPAFGKYDLAINTTVAPVVGEEFVFPRSWQYADHTPVDRALNDEIVPLGLDWDIVPATKTFTMYAPRKGTDLTASVTLSLTTNVASYSLNEDGAATETEVTYLGEGDGPDREEAVATDTTATGGLVLQGMYSAPPGTTIDKLDGLAAEKLGRSKQVVRVLTCVVYGSLVTTLALGDTVTVAISDGAVSLSGNWRIVSAELTPRNNTLSLTLNEEV